MSHSVTSANSTLVLNIGDWRASSGLASLNTALAPIASAIAAPIEVERFSADMMFNVNEQEMVETFKPIDGGFAASRRMACQRRNRHDGPSAYGRLSNGEDTHWTCRCSKSRPGNAVDQRYPDQCRARHEIRALRWRVRSHKAHARPRQDTGPA